VNAYARWGRGAEAPARACVSRPVESVSRNELRTLPWTSRKEASVPSGPMCIELARFAQHPSASQHWFFIRRLMRWGAVSTGGVSAEAGPAAAAV